MTYKRLILLSTTILTTLSLAACTTNNSDSTSSSETSTSESTREDLSQLELPQLDTEIKENESVVELTTTAGVITVKLFPEIAPKAVENFVTHAKDGYYDGTPFHRVIEGFMIQGGDPEGTGMGGESIWGEGFEVEISNQLYHIRGALSMARAQALDSQGSQFFIVQGTEDQSDGMAIQFTPERIIEAYKNGGAKSLDGNYTVFGQVIEGMDVVDKIAQAEVTSNGSEVSTPVDPVTIESTKVLQEAK
ncbi:peptidylprolyl isomerase [Enterococcus aquimarinus]|uniref:peptidylprolyl isomerase n=1 Tax=Enterococcus TaxID=1350 RepID=UPI00090030D7|nr:peptidylprolyl isomerase [Enterococcus aquimarinus]